MTIIASMIINAVTDTVTQSQGFDLATFTIFVSAAQWTVELDRETAGVGPRARHVSLIVNNIQNVRGASLNPAAGASPLPDALIFLAVVSNVTGGLEPLVGTQDQVYVIVQRMFRDPVP